MILLCLLIRKVVGVICIWLKVLVMVLVLLMVMLNGSLCVLVNLVMKVGGL